jgi:hypothetical protein
MTDLRTCYFCEESYPYPSCFINNYNGLWICKEVSICENILPKINTIEEQIECPICYEIKTVIELPNCCHKICLACCKYINFGKSTQMRPLHWREINIESPNWPYNDDEVEEEIKFNLYDTFEDTHREIVDYSKSIDELIHIRNGLLDDRPEWMNTEEFINYENDYFRYHIECSRIEKIWDEYENSKLKGNMKCPLCRVNF